MVLARCNCEGGNFLRVGCSRAGKCAKLYFLYQCGQGHDHAEHAAPIAMILRSLKLFVLFIGERNALGVAPTVKIKFSAKYCPGTSAEFVLECDYVFFL